MPYKVTFKGDRTPEILDDENGEKLYQRRKEGTLTVNVELKKGLLVAASSIKDVECITDNSSRIAYSKEELMTFADQELRPYLNNGYLSQIGELLFYEAKDLIYLPGDPNGFAGGRGIEVRKDKTKELAVMKEKIYQFKFMQGRKYLASKRDMKNLDESMSDELESETANKLCLCGCKKVLKTSRTYRVEFFTDACEAKHIRRTNSIQRVHARA